MLCLDGSDEDVVGGPHPIQGEPVDQHISWCPPHVAVPGASSLRRLRARGESPGRCRPTTRDDGSAVDDDGGAEEGISMNSQSASTSTDNDGVVVAVDGSEQGYAA